MRKIGVFLILFITIAISALAYADEYYKFVKITWAPEVNFLEVQATGIYNIRDYVWGKEGAKLNFIGLKKLRDRYGLYLGKGTIKNKCTLKGKVIRTEIMYAEARERGMCGADPSATFSLWIDGVEFIKNVGFHESCLDMPSVYKVSLDTDDFLEICIREGGESKLYHCSSIFITDLESRKPITMEYILNDLLKKSDKRRQ